MPPVTRILPLLPLILLLGACSDDPAAPDPLTGGLDLLPDDTGGVHVALPRDPDAAAAAPYGCFVYLPTDWEASAVGYPLLVFLHGAGERGDSHDNPETLDLVLRNGPPKLIDNGEWAPPHPMIVASPQCHTGSWQAADVREFLEWLDAGYPVDRTRIYLTGLSMGGFGTWSYLGAYGDLADDPLPIAAAAPICGGGGTGNADAMAKTPIWAFHGTGDGTVAPSGSVNLVKAVGAANPVVAPRLTLYEGVGHDSWSRTYDGSGVGQGILTYEADPAVEPWLVPYEPDLYTWLFSCRH